MPRLANRPTLPSLAAAALLLPLGLGACQIPNPAAQSTTATTPEPAGTSATGANTAAPAPDQSEAVTHFTQFNDIPVPANADIDLEESLVLGTEDGWIGRLALDVGYEMIEMYGFYQTEMPKFGWEQLTTVRSKVSTMTYRRGNRVSTITLIPGGVSGTEVDFTVAPGNATVLGNNSGAI